MDVNWPSINTVIIPAIASIFLGDSCITNVHTRSTNACYAGAILIAREFFWGEHRADS